VEERTPALVGVRRAKIITVPRAAGLHEQLATNETVETAAHPGIIFPLAKNFALPATDPVAISVIAVRYTAVVPPPDLERVTVDVGALREKFLLYESEPAAPGVARL
jgi:hypothetical protein